MVGWVEERNPTLSRILLGFAIAQPNLHFLNRQVLRVIRNRVFHHEPIFNTRNLSFDGLLTTYENAKKLLGWLSEDALCFFEENNQFEKLVNSIPSSMRSLS